MNLALLIQVAGYFYNKLNGAQEILIKIKRTGKLEG